VDDSSGRNFPEAKGAAECISRRITRLAGSFAIGGEADSKKTLRYHIHAAAWLATERIV
jgi:hypothetical protein